MPGSTSKAEQDLVALKLTVASLSALLTQLQSTPAPTSNELPASISSNNPISPLSLAHDCASLVKAHTTKLSLLLITPPFTPSALTPILHALSTGPLPGLASSITLCSPASYTSLLSSELRHSVTRLFSTLEALVSAIPLDGTVLEKEKRDGGRGSLVGTGAVWDACDVVMGLRELGIAGICVRRVEGWRELVKDALEELREWGEGEDDGEEDDGSEDEKEEGEEDAQDILDSMFSSERHIPASDPRRIRPRLETTLKRLRLLILLYTALVKRRFNTLPLALGESSIATIDVVLDELKKIPDVVDELASAFYDLNPREIDVRMRECFEAGKKAAKEVEKDWKGGDDEFTAWAGKFKNSMEENW